MTNFKKVEIIGTAAMCLKLLQHWKKAPKSLKPFWIVRPPVPNKSKFATDLDHYLVLAMSDELISEFLTLMTAGGFEFKSVSNHVLKPKPVKDGKDSKVTPEVSPSKEVPKEESS